MSLFKYFQENDTAHSKSNAYLLSLVCTFIYDSKESSLIYEGFQTRLTHLFARLSGSGSGEGLTFEPFTLGTTQGYPYNTQAGVLFNSHFIIVVFRGTEGAPIPGLNPLLGNSLKDWLTNSQAFVLLKPSDSWPGKVHRGFYNALQQKYAQIRDAVKEARSNNQKVFLTGHSLGGALATLCAYRFQKFSDIDVAGVYTFGAPRVGNVEWRTDYDLGQNLRGKTFRWARGKDFAAALPFVPDPPGPGGPPSNMQYFHVGQLNYIESDGNIKMELSNPDLLPEVGPKTAASIATLSIGDHSMPLYCRAMYKRVSDNARQSAAQPDYLVSKDVLAALGIC